MFNKYYTAISPFQILRKAGSKPSNTWIGASRVIDTIYEEVTVMPGEELHDLCGGLFHIDGEGVSHESRLTRPPHIFEAHYHRGAEGARMQALVAQDFIAPEDDPRKGIRYRP